MNTLLRALNGPEDDSPAAIFSRLPVLKTSRLLLRMARMSDAEDIFAYSRDPEVARHVLWSAHQSIGQSRGYLRFLIRQYRDAQPSSYVVVHQATGRVIGTIGFMEYSEELNMAEIGYSLGREWWNQGLATEAVAALLPLCFERLRLNRVEAVHEVDNPASGRVLEKCGFTREGTLRARVRNKGSLHDVVMWSLLASDNRKPKV